MTQPTLTIEWQPSGRSATLKLKLADRVLDVDDTNPRKAAARATLRDRWLGLLSPHLAALGRTERELSNWIDERLVAVADEIERARVAQESKDGKPSQGRALEFETVEPWPSDVDGSALLDELAAAVRRHVVMTEDCARACALWVAHTWLLDRITYSPRLNVTAPTKKAGKSTLFEVLDALVCRPINAQNISASALGRLVELTRPCLLLDEADSWMDENEELRGIVNSGCRPTGAIIRCVGDDHEPRVFSCFSALALSGIGRRQATIEDRSIAIELRRKTANESAEPVRLERIKDELRTIRQRLAKFAFVIGPKLADADPQLPPALTNRDADKWRPLIAIADLAGGHWPASSRAAAVRFVAASSESAGDGFGTLLLEDLRTIFAARPLEGRFTTDSLLSHLNGLEDRPWPSVNKGRQLDARRLGRLLEPFGIRSRSIRTSGGTPKGYSVEDFHDAFSRYLTDAQHNVEEPVSHPPQRHKPTTTGVSGRLASATPTPHVADTNCPPALEPQGMWRCGGNETGKSGVDENDTLGDQDVEDVLGRLSARQEGGK